MSKNWATAFQFVFPPAAVEALELKEGDDIEIHIAGRRDLAMSRNPGREALLMKLRIFRGLPANFKFDRDEANAR